ncbi:MAG TPA: hypothetical protein VF792_03990 [Ktedonobacterales bacterium]
MSKQPTPIERASMQAAASAKGVRTQPQESLEYAEGEMACPVCFAPMPNLKGGKATICPNCGFKDSCCF